MSDSSRQRYPRKVGKAEVLIRLLKRQPRRGVNAERIIDVSAPYKLQIPLQRLDGVLVAPTHTTAGVVDVAPFDADANSSLARVEKLSTLSYCSRRPLSGSYQRNPFTDTRLSQLPPFWR